ncbi:MAG: bifunctional (p)ppGpp synthetase/guanosine-3',5'-bis(diphosphate) 3'-pyrophosphohydrolase [Dehalococcoidales bacterium]|nr:bifunctional (p)ppGpp synthetase/guanosine-3',5'-bis(diphosphate) 3'-pyrophosphohydrolase [Dehalococcoidales bacterium]
MLKQKNTTVNILLRKASVYLPPEKLSLVEDAYKFAEKAHDGQLRESGEPYLEHPLQVAITLADLQMDASALAASLLHDVCEDCGISVSEVEKKFGIEVAKLVDGVTKLSHLSLQLPEGVSRKSSAADSQQQAESLRKMLVAMAEDLRVVFIKLADRLHNMRTLVALPAEKQRYIARETMDIYAPLAHRLGIWELKWELEDLAFRYLEPKKYAQLAKMIAGKRTEREEFIEKVIDIIRKEFERLGFEAEISGRPKHLYSINQKIQKYSAQGKQFNDIYDLFALRVLVDSVQDCYNAVGIVHSMWHPVPGAFDDYIANPKPNGYQSLHTVVMAFGTTPIEIQIRTRDMHYTDEYGIAAHWRYKEGKKDDSPYEERIGWLRQLIDWHRELSGTEEFLESVKTDIFIDQVFVFTPKGEVKDLPKGATPLDFAYRIHTELGHRCIGAKVNNRLVSLNYQLNNGDVVEIITTRRDKGPSRDWLSPHLGYIHTSHAREKIRQWFKKQERDDNIEQGRELLDKELKQLGLKYTDRESIAKFFKYSNVDDFLAAIGYGGITVESIALKLAAQQEQPRVIPEIAPLKQVKSEVQVLGVGELLTNLAHCCNPVPGDDIVGYVTRSRGITIHRRDCFNIINEDEKERLIEVEWGQTEAQYPVTIQVDAWDRVGLVRDVSTIVAEDKINILSMNVTEHGDRTTTLLLTLETKGLAHLSRLLTRLGGVRGVLNITRVGDESSFKQKNMM